MYGEKIDREVDTGKWESVYAPDNPKGKNTWKTCTNNYMFTCRIFACCNIFSCFVSGGRTQFIVDPNQDEDDDNDLFQITKVHETFEKFVKNRGIGNLSGKDGKLYNAAAKFEDVNGERQFVW